MLKLAMQLQARVNAFKELVTCLLIVSDN